MKHFIIYNASGEILRTGIVPDEAFEFQKHSEDEYLLEGTADIEKDTVDVTKRAVVPGGKPPPPIDMDYTKARAQAYPAMQEQLDMLWHAMDSGTIPKAEPFYSSVKAVKEAYPKDNSVVPGSAVIYPEGGV